LLLAGMICLKMKKSLPAQILAFTNIFGIIGAKRAAHFTVPPKFTAALQMLSQRLNNVLSLILVTGVFITWPHLVGINCSAQHSGMIESSGNSGLSAWSRSL